METFESTLGILFEKGENYTKTSLELIKLKLAEQSANLISFLLNRILILLFFFVVILLISIGFSLLIGGLLGKVWVGFFIVSLLNCTIGYLLYAYRNYFIKTPITNLILNAFKLKK